MHTCLANLVIHIETTANLLCCKTNKQKYFFQNSYLWISIGFPFHEYTSKNCDIKNRFSLRKANTKKKVNDVLEVKLISQDVYIERKNIACIIGICYFSTTSNWHGILKCKLWYPIKIRLGLYYAALYWDVTRH